jgi:hypothetical protein
MADPDPDQATYFQLQSEQTASRSPLYSALCARLAADPDVAEIIESPPRWDAPLRLLSGLHNLVLDGRARWDEVSVALVEHRDFLRRFVAEQGVQTNEVQRCWMLLPCFLEAARRLDASTLDIIELGPSAGLNLSWDRYRYRYAAGGWGPADGLLTLGGEERRPVPADLLAHEVRVRERVGVDLDPIDVTTAAGARLLRSFVWADQSERLTRLDEAIDVTRRNPPHLMQGDIADLLPSVLADRRDDTPLLVWHTSVLGYLPDERRAAVYQAVAAAGQRGPIAFVGTTAANDGSQLHYGLSVQTWPDGTREQLAHADFHGAWIDWLDEAERTHEAGRMPGV